MEELTKEQKVQEEEYVFPYHYLDLASDYHKYLSFIEYKLLFNHIKEIVSDLMNPSGETKFLDAGCGDGRFCYELKDLGCEIVGVDYSERAISFARGFNPDIKFYVQDLETLELPFKFDIVLLSGIIPHLIPEKIPTIMLNLSKVMEKNGTLIIIAASKNKPLIEKHYQHFSKEGLAKVISPYFRIEKIRGYSNLTNHKKRYIFNILRKYGKFVFPFSGKKIPIAKRYFNYVHRYYKENLFMGKPEDCKGLIAICKKV